MLIEDIVEDEGAIWIEGRISWLSINRDYYQGKMVQVFDAAFCPCSGLSPGASF